MDNFEVFASERILTWTYRLCGVPVREAPEG
jgi:hypothetical protein